MRNLVVVDHEVYLEGEGDTLVRFDGTPIAGLTPEAVVGEVHCLECWQKDPGKYGPFYALADIVPDNRENPTFKAGGLWPFMLYWADGYHSEIQNARIFDSRQHVRDLSEAAGGVAW
jgi:hypothetical protein